MFDRGGNGVARAKDRKVRDVEGRIAEAMGVVNAAHALLVDLVGELADGDLWCGPGLASLEHYVALKTGMSVGRARELTRAVVRREALGAVLEAFRAGEVSLDQVAVVARFMPDDHDRSVAVLARSLTVGQLRRTLRSYGWDMDAAPEPGPDAEPVPGEPTPGPVEPERTVSMSTDEHGRWHGRFCLPADEGALFERAIRAHREDLYRQQNADLPDGSDPVRVSNADALVSVAEAALAAGEARYPGADRYLTHLHLEAGPAGPDRAAARAGVAGAGAAGAGAAGAGAAAVGVAGALSLHWGPVLPTALRRLLLCDGSFVPILERDGIPVSVGRKTRAIGKALRRGVEHRDGGCAVPGCGQRVGTEIHHIVHWEDGGGTDTHNLVCLCRRHHRLHHQGLIGIDGNPDLPVGTQGALHCTDRWHHPIQPTHPKLPTRPATTTDPGTGSTPTEPDGRPDPIDGTDGTDGAHPAAPSDPTDPAGPGQPRPAGPEVPLTPAEAAEAMGLDPTPFPPLPGGRLDANHLALAPNVGSPQHERLKRQYAQAQARRDARTAARAAADAADHPTRPRHQHRPTQDDRPD